MENHYLLASSAFWLPAKRNGHDATPLVPHEHSIVPSINNYAMGSEVESPRHWPQGHWIPPRVYVTGHLDVFWQLPFQRTFGTQGPECCFCSFIFVKCQTSSNQVELDTKKLLAEIVGKHRLINSLWFIYQPSQTFSSFLVDAPLF